MICPKLPLTGGIYRQADTNHAVSGGPGPNHSDARRPETQAGEEVIGTRRFKRRCGMQLFFTVKFLPFPWILLTVTPGPPTVL